MRLCFQEYTASETQSPLERGPEGGRPFGQIEVSMSTEHFVLRSPAAGLLTERFHEPPFTVLSYALGVWSPLPRTPALPAEPPIFHGIWHPLFDTPQHLNKCVPGRCSVCHPGPLCLKEEKWHVFSPLPGSHLGISPYWSWAPGCILEIQNSGHGWGKSVRNPESLSKEFQNLGLAVQAWPVVLVGCLLGCHFLGGSRFQATHTAHCICSVHERTCPKFRAQSFLFGLDEHNEKKCS